MKMAFVVNDIATEQVNYTTTHLAFEAIRRGHELWYINLSDFAYGPDEHVHANAVHPLERRCDSAKDLLSDLQSAGAVRRRITLDSIDVLMLRNDPAEDFSDRPWARLAGINFGRLATRHGAIVLNDPDGLNHAVNKTYLQYFPKSVRPRSLITRNREEIREFCEGEGGTIVVKPLAGSGGRNVFLVRPEDAPNFNQMIESILRDGYIIAQEYLPLAVEGDTRLFLMNGRVLRHGDNVAAIRRLRTRGDMRSNLTAGGTSAPADVTDTMTNLAETVGPRLIEDGIFLAGLDIVGDKIMEINVFSPGALHDASRLAGVNFMEVVIAALEHKVDYRNRHGYVLENAEMAVL